jgi:hypothetical protein
MMEPHAHLDLHPAIMVELNGHVVAIDVGIFDLVVRLNEIPGVETIDSCQGCPEACSDDAYVHMTIENDDAVEQVLELVSADQWHSNWEAVLIVQPREENGKRAYRLSFPNKDMLPLFNLEKFGRESAGEVAEEAEASTSDGGGGIISSFLALFRSKKAK